MPLPKLKKLAPRTPKPSSSPLTPDDDGLGAFDVIFAGLFFIGAAYLILKGRSHVAEIIPINRGTP